MERNFRQLLEERWSEGKFVCVGLDSDFEKIPGARVGGVMRTILGFNRQIIEATHDLVCAYKPNIAFYEAYGEAGWLALRETIVYARKVAPEVPVILDAKRADIGNTNQGYVKNIFGFLDVDAVTVNPYLGGGSLKPFLDQKNKGVIVLCRTSNPSAGEFQNLRVSVPSAFENGDRSLPFYQYVAERVRYHWNEHGNCGLVVGATAPKELAEIRRIVGDMPILIPGIGTQGGDIVQTVAAGKDSRDKGMIINSSSKIIFSENPRAETQKLHSAVCDCLTAKV
ncbi:MAG: orotidine 5'-phosphate decarboxylase [Candidatus Zambryskibacteria bacterium RIFCSPLOWO2_02_FULL_51_21]|uniref:Orotidine-5'-phosphate decarboxylase n=1 Tax=Candidatus Zambryskibacteria bacterium RIFCSPHIGHO2_02_FULL_43_37 TaxID=1802749 RepID=A0A1G2TH02_9BACT|nr:MAG: orotidine 5'-phosphate decarboxylase [Candidatus Zambryskibacteria bacterium RIFCSPHIGHO2_01_FULL_52_18]OHA96570.1 MAG: orotidine 5'-phosphate decarboxylase [Candidatus Zambryskibacteria bacterium RIFCSPHIGHO2_02_FULL_43_37]OHB07620.1 MAG: orotidine 5'-phosphate decarboxylase [Candidatus Zambryskibacteria bacterium RIFCSPLOWO2_01_FULL_52_12]OHB11166.1 MAG: orotidine 5'-phosphate decarboxylase [Candidatus Zambryskibacteria bacterium RIFCSPLOWO2_02_FULL_51_21]